MPARPGRSTRLAAARWIVSRHPRTPGTDPGTYSRDGDDRRGGPHPRRAARRLPLAPGELPRAAAERREGVRAAVPRTGRPVAGDLGDDRYRLLAAADRFVLGGGAGGVA